MILQGMQAYRAGKDVEENPWHPGTSEWHQWRDGWYLAEYEETIVD